MLGIQAHNSYAFFGGGGRDKVSLFCYVVLAILELATWTRLEPTEICLLLIPKYWD